MSLMGSIWSKYVIFCENGPNWVILSCFWGQNYAICQNFFPNGIIYIYFSCNKPSRGVSRLPNVFLAKKLSKYRLKRPKYSSKKPEKTPKMAKIVLE